MDDFWKSIKDNQRGLPWFPPKFQSKPTNETPKSNAISTVPNNIGKNVPSSSTIAKESHKTHNSHNLKNPQLKKKKKLQSNGSTNNRVLNVQMLIAKKFATLIFLDVDKLTRELNYHNDPNSIMGIILDWKNQPKQFLLLEDRSFKPVLSTLLNEKQKQQVSLECLFAENRPRYPFFTLSSDRIKEQHEFDEKCCQFFNMLKCYFGLKKSLFLGDNQFIEHSNHKNSPNGKTFVWSLIVCFANIAYISSKEQKEDFEEFLQDVKSDDSLKEINFECDKLIVWSSENQFQASQNSSEESKPTSTTEEKNKTSGINATNQAKTDMIASWIYQPSIGPSKAPINFIKLKRTTTTTTTTSEEVEIGINSREKILEDVLKRILSGDISGQEQQVLKKFKIELPLTQTRQISNSIETKAERERSDHLKNDVQELKKKYDALEIQYLTAKDILSEFQQGNVELKTKRKLEDENSELLNLLFQKDKEINQLKPSLSFSSAKEKRKENIESNVTQQGHSSETCVLESPRLDEFISTKCCRKKCERTRTKIFHDAFYDWMEEHHPLEERITKSQIKEILKGEKYKIHAKKSHGSDFYFGIRFIDNNTSKINHCSEK